MNLRDSEVIIGLLRQEGYELVDLPEKADVVLFNTCSVRAHAEDRVWSQIGLLASQRVKGATRQPANPSTRKQIIGVIGCMAQNYKKEIFRRAECVDIVCGPDNIGNIALYIQEAIRDRKKVLSVKEGRRKDAIYHTGFYEKKDHAYVVISEGCENYCSYCIVPYTRGRLRHRPAASIIREVKEVVGAGITHITLLGQNVTGYRGQGSRLPARQAGHRKQKINFTGLLEKVCAIEGLKSVTFMTSHPKDVDVKLFKLMAAESVIRPSLHLPLQSGSDKILKAMNRGYTVKKYLEIIDQFKKIVYNGNISTDIIIGFPGETDADFQKTFDVVKSVCFDSAFIFKYSPREGTKAYLMKGNVPEDVIRERHARLLELQRGISKKNRGQRTETSLRVDG
ncbi:MAG: tRNA (N6-isopentenyl adenosine(37)-C2)-methylthiotransferase MiaB [Candidatus Omnitrophota bacterium]